MENQADADTVAVTRWVSFKLESRLKQNTPEDIHLVPRFVSAERELGAYDQRGQPDAEERLLRQNDHTRQTLT